MTIRELSEKPVEVVHAVRLLYIIVGLGVVRAVITVMRHMDVRSPEFLIGLKVVLYAVSIYLIYQLARGRNWARWSLVIMLAACIPLTILPALESLSHNPLPTILGFLQLILYVIALYFLFTKRSSGWFQPKQ